MNCVSSEARVDTDLQGIWCTWITRGQACDCRDCIIIRKYPAPFREPYRYKSQRAANKYFDYLNGRTTRNARTPHFR